MKPQEKNLTTENTEKKIYIKRLKYLSFYECVIIHDASYSLKKLCELCGLRSFAGIKRLII